MYLVLRSTFVLQAGICIPRLYQYHSAASTYHHTESRRDYHDNHDGMCKEPPFNLLHHCMRALVKLGFQAP